MKQQIDQIITKIILLNQYSLIHILLDRRLSSIDDAIYADGLDSRMNRYNSAVQCSAIALTWIDPGIQTISTSYVIFHIDII